MNDTAQRVAIAAWMGWSQIEDAGRPLMLPAGIVLRGYPPTGAVIGHKLDFPNYTNDLRAIHDAEAKLDEFERRRFVGVLLDKCVRRTDDMYWDVCHATAAQRAEALLRAIGLWASDAPAPSPAQTAPNA